MDMRRSRRAACVPLVVVLVTAITGCQSDPAPDPAALPGMSTVITVPAATPEKSGGSSPDDVVNRVLAISVDGLNPRAIRKLGRSRTPAFHRLMREGAWTFNARTERESTSTLPNHTGMLTSRRVDERHRGHGVSFNRDDGGTVHQAAGHYVASVFDVVHDRGGATALFTAKPKFRFYQRTWNTHGARDRTGADDGRAKIDRFTVDQNNARLVARLNADLRRSPRQFTFLHLSLPDRAGHRYGFMSKEYLAAVRRTDRLLGSVLATIADRPALRRQTLVVLTADHGGRGATHSRPARLQNYRIPFMAWGPGVAAGRNLHALNPTFRGPGNSRPSYSGEQPVRNGDLANLVTDALDLPKVPGSELNARRTLNVFGG